MAAVTTESAEDLALAVCDEARLVVKAIHVRPVKGLTVAWSGRALGV